MKNGNYIFCGHLGITSAIICTNANGEVLWNETYGENGEYSYFHAMRETNGGIIAAGYKNINGNRNGWVVKVNFAGEIIWVREHRGGNGRRYSDMVSYEDGFYLGGYSNAGTFTKINDNGNETFHDSYDNFNFCYGIQKLSMNGAVLVGVTNNLEYPCALRVNAEGVEIWN